MIHIKNILESFEFVYDKPKKVHYLIHNKDKKTIGVYFDKKNENTFQWYFKNEDTSIKFDYSLTNDNIPFTIFSIMREIIIDFLHNHPEVMNISFIYDADENKRKKVYYEKIFKPLGFSIIMDNDSNHYPNTKFVLMGL